MIRHWTTAEYRLIHDNPDKTNQELSDLTGRSVDAIAAFRCRNGLSRKRENIWKPREVEILRINRTRKNKEIGQLLGRTAKAVQGARDRFDLQKRTAK